MSFLQDKIIPQASLLKKTELKSFVLLVLIGIIVYANSVVNPFIWDDQCLVVDNYLIKDYRYIGDIFKTEVTHGEVKHSQHFRPIQIVVYALIYHLFGLKQFWYHFLNIIVFCLNAILVYFLVGIISKEKIVALLTSLFFITHPIYTSAVTYISGLADPLMGVFLLVCLILFIKYQEYKGIKRTIVYLVSIFSFVLALLSKEVAIIVPLILVVYDLIFNKTNFNKPINILKRYAIFFLVDFLYIYLRLTVLKFSDILPPTAKFSFDDRFLIFLNAINSYFGLLILPLNLHMSRDYYLPKTLFDIPTMFSIISLIIVIGLIIYAHRRSREIFFFCIWFFVFLLPQSALFFPINAFMAEHFLYLPAMGFFFVLTKGLIKICSKKALILIATLLICFYSLLTFTRNYEYRDPVYFYNSIIKLSPRSWAAHNNLAQLYLDRRQYEKAFFHLKESLRLYSSQITARSNLVRFYEEQGEYEEAIKQYREFFEIDPEHKPAEIHNNMGVLYYKMGKHDKAIEEYTAALKINSQLYLTYHNLAFAYFKKGLTDEAIATLERSLDLGYLPSKLDTKFKPQRKEYLNFLDFDNADAYQIYTRLGTLYGKYKLYGAAKESFQVAINLKPDLADGYYNLGVAYWNQGNFAQSAKLWRQALKIDPNHFLAKEWLKGLSKTK